MFVVTSKPFIFSLTLQSFPGQKKILSFKSRMKASPSLMLAASIGTEKTLGYLAPLTWRSLGSKNYLVGSLNPLSIPPGMYSTPVFLK
jgi:hypothetical protein